MSVKCPVTDIDLASSIAADLPLSRSDTLAGMVSSDAGSAQPPVTLLVLPADGTAAAHSATKILPCLASRAAGEIVQCFPPV